LQLRQKIGVGSKLAPLGTAFSNDRILKSNNRNSRWIVPTGAWSRFRLPVGDSTLGLDQAILDRLFDTFCTDRCVSAREVLEGSSLEME